MWIFVRKVRLPIHGGICPSRSSDSRSSAVTRDACLLLQVTPDQLQNCSESFFHEARSLAEVVRWSLRQRRAWRSVLESFWGAIESNEDA
uniref:Uncharacterized protein n=1 Tax=Triticum urartu TaxID=4572 RepID=A0A8R7R1S6_TRIUA